MYGIVTYIGVLNGVNVCNYSIHGWSGKDRRVLFLCSVHVSHLSVGSIIPESQVKVDNISYSLGYS